MTESPLLTTEITTRLRNRISQLRSKDFVRFMPERLLAEDLKVSRQTVRTAVKTLISEGLLVQRQGSGTYIVPELKIKRVNLLKAEDLKSNDPFYMMFVVEISHHLAYDSIPLMIVSGNKLPDKPVEDPLVIIGYLKPEFYRIASQKFKYRIAVQSHPIFSDITQIDTDYYKIGYDAVAELSRHNHKRLLHLAGPDEFPAAAARSRGFGDAVRDFGYKGYSIGCKMNWNSGYEIADEVYSSYVKSKRITGIFAANDWMGIGLMGRLTELGVKVPNDLSIIGCDDIPLASEVIPGLTTFREDFPLLISEVYEHINQMCLSSASYVPKKILLPAKLIQRATVAAI